MYNVSSAFHEAVANGNHQIALLIFEDAVFTNDDIDIERGIEFKDVFCSSEDLEIGQALSNEITFSLFNDKRLLNDYEFGEFTATIGVQVAQENVTTGGTVYAESDEHIYIGSDTAPYLTRDGAAVSTQPGAPVRSILISNGIVYCGLTDGSVVAYEDSEGGTYGVDMNAFMLNQFAVWAGKGIHYDPSTWLLYIWQNNVLKTYEFAPLGVFIAERPNTPDENVIDMTCNDRMMKFEQDMPSANEGTVTFPASIVGLFVQLCDIADVPYQTDTFINSTAMLSARPDDFETVTMRDVLRWLAEAACSNARFDRDGYLVMDWIRSTEQTISENGYSEFRPYWYETKQITKLHNRASDGSYDKTSGDGDEGYLIQDNPLLKGVT